MKTLTTLFLFIVCLSAKAQDTLYLLSGKIQVVELIAVNKEAGIIQYKNGNQLEIRSIASLKSFSNHANVDEGNWTMEEGTLESGAALRKKNSFSAKDPSKYTYSKISLGVNLLSPFSVVGYEYDFSIATNYNQSLYVQYNFNNQIGIRLPMRIGFNQLKDTTNDEESGFYWKHERELFGEGGFEFIYMKDDNQRINPYIMPGIYFGVNQGMINIYNDTNYTYSSYYPAPRHTYYRIGLTGGVQFNFSKYFQLNTELGFNYNNATKYYNYWPNSVYYSNTYKRLGLQAAINLVYRFGGKKRT